MKTLCVSQGVISTRLCVDYLWVIAVSSIYRVKRLNGKFDPKEERGSQLV